MPARDVAADVGDQTGDGDRCADRFQHWPPEDVDETLDDRPGQVDRGIPDRRDDPAGEPERTATEEVRRQPQFVEQDRDLVGEEVVHQGAGCADGGRRPPTGRGGVGCGLARIDEGLIGRQGRKVGVGIVGDVDDEQQEHRPRNGEVGRAGPVGVGWVPASGELRPRCRGDLHPGGDQVAERRRASGHRRDRVEVGAEYSVAIGHLAGHGVELVLRHGDAASGDGRVSDRDPGIFDGGRHPGRVDGDGGRRSGRQRGRGRCRGGRRRPADDQRRREHSGKEHQRDQPRS